MVTVRGVRLLPGDDFLHVVEFPDSLAGLQAAVGGYLEELAKLVLSPKRALIVWGDEEGRLKGLVPNRRVNTAGKTTLDVVGPIVITARDDEGETYSLTDDELEIVRKLAERWPRL